MRSLSLIFPALHRGAYADFVSFLGDGIEKRRRGTILFVRHLLCLDLLGCHRGLWTVQTEPFPKCPTQPHLPCTAIHPVKRAALIIVQSTTSMTRMEEEEVWQPQDTWQLDRQVGQSITHPPIIILPLMVLRKIVLGALTWTVMT